VNYAKGMFRLWMVVAGCWMAIAVSIHYDGEMQAYKFVGSDYDVLAKQFGGVSISPQDSAASASDETYCDYGPRSCKAVNKLIEINPFDKTDFRNWEPDWPKRLMIIFEYALAGPLVLLLLGVAAAWIARGFRTAPIA